MIAIHSNICLEEEIKKTDKSTDSFPVRGVSVKRTVTSKPYVISTLPSTVLLQVLHVCIIFHYYTSSKRQILTFIGILG